MTANKARLHFDQGLNFFQNGNIAKAQSYFMEAILEEPHFDEAIYNLSCCFAASGNKDKALLYLSRAKRLNAGCVQWAQEDPEFKRFHDDAEYLAIISNNPNESSDSSNTMEPFFTVTPTKGPTSALLDESKVSDNDAPHTEIPFFEEKPKRTLTKQHCKSCGSLLRIEKIPTYNPQLLLLAIYAGMGLIFYSYFSILGLLGFPVFGISIYLFAQVEECKICKSCGTKESIHKKVQDQTEPSPAYTQSESPANA